MPKLEEKDRAPVDWNIAGPLAAIERTNGVHPGDLSVGYAEAVHALRAHNSEPAVANRLLEIGKSAENFGQLKAVEQAFEGCPLSEIAAEAASTLKLREIELRLDQARKEVSSEYPEPRPYATSNFRIAELTTFLFEHQQSDQDLSIVLREICYPHTNGVYSYQIWSEEDQTAWFQCSDPLAKLIAGTTDPRVIEILKSFIKRDLLEGKGHGNTGWVGQDWNKQNPEGLSRAPILLALSADESAKRYVVEVAQTCPILRRGLSAPIATALGRLDFLEIGVILAEDLLALHSRFDSAGVKALADYLKRNPNAEFKREDLAQFLDHDLRNVASRFIDCWYPDRGAIAKWQMRRAWLRENRELTHGGLLGRQVKICAALVGASEGARKFLQELIDRAGKGAPNLLAHLQQNFPWVLPYLSKSN